MSETERLDAELRDVITTIRLQVRADGWHKLREAILDIHSPISVSMPGDWPLHYAVCAHCRNERGELRVVWPCKTATAAMGDDL